MVPVIEVVSLAVGFLSSSTGGPERLIISGLGRVIVPLVLEYQAHDSSQLTQGHLWITDSMSIVYVNHVKK